MSVRVCARPNVRVLYVLYARYAADHNLELDVLKVDVEGFDLAVLAGALHQLEHHLW